MEGEYGTMVALNEDALPCFEQDHDITLNLMW